MKILYVVNNFYVKGNGLSASAQRTVKYLREAGLDIKVLSGAEETSYRKRIESYDRRLQAYASSEGGIKY